MDGHKQQTIAVVGAGVFGLSLALALRKRGHAVTVFDKYRYDQTGYIPSDGEPELAASVDHNKIFRASYGTKLHYQHLALESRERWQSLNKDHRNSSDRDLFVPCGMLRVQPTSKLGALEKETLANMERDGLRATQFVKSSIEDRERAAKEGWEGKLLDFAIPGATNGETFEAVLDSLAGFTSCGSACAVYQKLAEDAGVVFKLGDQHGAFDGFVEQAASGGKKKVTGLRTKDGQQHVADTVVVAAGSFSTQICPDLSYHIESSAGSLATFKLEKGTELWDKYGPEKFPVMTWKSAPRSKDGKDTGSVYVLPRTPEGLVKIGYRGVKFTNFQPAPQGIRFAQDGKWSIPMPPSRCRSLPKAATEAIRDFVEIFLPELKDTPFHSTQLCWYTDTLDNSFLIDYVPTYAENSVFVCTGGSGHGAKFMPVLGEHAADIFENGEDCKTPMRSFWRWREDAARKNGLEEGPEGPRNLTNGREHY